MNKVKFLLFLLIIQLLISSVIAQNDQTGLESKYLSDLAIDMQWFLSYLNGEDNKRSFNEFALKRGYVNIKKRINNTFSGRITTDITVDKEGDGEGDVEIRLKYLYFKFLLPSYGIFHKPYFEFGLVHRPWIDFEQHVNVYRVQGTMFLERNNVINSGDYGAVFLSLLGDEMDEHYKNTGNRNFAGTYGSIAIGIFNGGGYHALEKNKNKSLESRLTIRPLYKIIPGLQFSYHGAVGKGNITESPDWKYNAGYISYEIANLILTSEYYNGKGNYKGSAIQDTVSFEAVPQNGYSFFVEWKIFKSKISVIGRYDQFTQEFRPVDLTTKRTIVGLAFHFIHGSKIILDYDYVNYSDKAKKDSHVFEVAIELKY